MTNPDPNPNDELEAADDLDFALRVARERGSAITVYVDGYWTRVYPDGEYWKVPAKGFPRTKEVS